MARHRVDPKAIEYVSTASALRGRTYVTKVYVFDCRQCGKEFRWTGKTLRERSGEFCSIQCGSRGRNVVGKEHHNWGARGLIANGYVVIRAHGNPMADKRGYVPEHRLVMSQHIGRPLRREEVVHHINHVKTDNRLENLELLASQSEHERQHHSSWPERRTGSEVPCGTCGAPVWREPCQQRVHKRHFCSRSCQHQALRAR